MMALRPSLIAKAVDGTWISAPENDAPLAGVSIDSREELANTLFVAIRGETHDGHTFAGAAVERGAAMLLVDHDVHVRASTCVLRVDDTRRALMQLAAWYRSTFTETTVIAVTGSAGKTTTRELIHAVLGAALPGVASPKSFNNDIGVPLSLLLVRAEHRYAVIEVGINAVGEMQPLAEIARPDIAVITNIGDSHLEGLHDVATVAREKLKLASALQPNGVAILHADSPALRDANLPSCDITWFGESDRADVRLTHRGVDANGPWLALADGTRFQLALAGKHNAINALAAIAVAHRLGIDDAAIIAGLARRPNLPMRMQSQTIAGIDITNDAYNANPQSMIAGVQAFLEANPSAARYVFVLGDMCELGGAGPQLHASTARRLAEKIADIAGATVICVGELATRHMAPVLREAVPGASITTIGAMTPAQADEIAGTLQPGDAVFIKGSRAMALETFVDAVACRAAAPSPDALPRQPAAVRP